MWSDKDQQMYSWIYSLGDGQSYVVFTHVCPKTEPCEYGLRAATLLYGISEVMLSSWKVRWTVPITLNLCLAFALGCRDRNDMMNG